MKARLVKEKSPRTRYVDSEGKQRYKEFEVNFALISKYGVKALKHADLIEFFGSTESPDTLDAYLRKDIDEKKTKYYREEVGEITDYPGTTVAVINDSNKFVIDDPHPFMALFARGSNPMQEEVKIPISDYAAIHGVTAEIIKKLCRDGRIPGAVQDGRAWRVPYNAPYPSSNHSEDPDFVRLLELYVITGFDEFKAKYGDEYFTLVDRDKINLVKTLRMQPDRLIFMVHDMSKEKCDEVGQARYDLCCVTAWYVRNSQRLFQIENYRRRMRGEETIDRKKYFEISEDEKITAYNKAKAKDEQWREGEKR